VDISLAGFPMQCAVNGVKALQTVVFANFSVCFVNGIRMVAGVPDYQYTYINHYCAVGNHLYRYSKVLDSHSVNEARARIMPTCPHLIWAQPHPLNFSAPM